MTNDDDQVEQATTFSVNEVPGGRRLDGSEEYSDYYDRLSKLNSLRWNGKWSNTAREKAIDRSAILDSIAGELQLTDYQHDEASRRFRKLPTDVIQAHQTPAVALAVCAIVGKEDGRTYHYNQAHGQTDENDIKNIVDDIGVSYSEFATIWRTIQEEVG